MIPFQVNGNSFHDDWWWALLKAIIILVIVLLWTIINVWYERRLLGFMNNRLGPNMNGPAGIMQTMSDGIKLIFKEDFSPKHVDKMIFNLAPTLIGLASFSVWSVIPFGGEVHIGEYATRLQLFDLPVAVLVIFAFASIGVYGIVLAGWSSSDSYSLLGGLRSSAQMISYEVAMGLSVVPVFLAAGSMSTADIVEAQAAHLSPFGVNIGVPGWYALLLIPSLCIFFISALGEANRTPFDLAECEQELVAGHTTEYSGFRFALYYLAEWIGMATQSAVAVTLFFGGYRAPWPFNLLTQVPGWEWVDSGWMGLFWFFFKTQLIITFIIWVRCSLVRYRYDQFMSLGWKRLIPIAIVWILAVATFMTARNQGWFSTPIAWAVFAAVMIAILAWTFWPEKQPAPKVIPKFDAFSGGYPVPPLPGQGGATTIPATFEPVVTVSDTNPDPEPVGVGTEKGA